jgi:ATP-binding cassette, subfamily B, bacterial
MGREDQETARFTDKVLQLRDAQIGIGRIRGVYDPIIDSIPSAGTLAVLLVGSIRLQQGAIGVSGLVGAAFLFALMDAPVRAIGWFLTALPRAVVAFDRIQKVLDATGEMVYGRKQLDPAPDVGAALHFEDVTFAYERGDKVLRQVSFTVRPGAVVALVGPTGSGKSTIASLAARLLDPDKGKVRLDGVNVRKLSAAALAETVGFVPQVPFVFDDTVRGNVALEREGIDDDAIRDALRAAQADGFVSRLPQGLDTELGERGTSVSGGQRQRLTLARALAGRPRLLILDDATSAVDPKVEAAILAGLRADATARAAQTVLVIAHRPATIAIADEVVYLERGRVVATGTHADLLRRVPGYAELVTAYERAEAERALAHEYTDDDTSVGARR